MEKVTTTIDHSILSDARKASRKKYDQFSQQN